MWLLFVHCFCGYLIDVVVASATPVLFIVVDCSMFVVVVDRSCCLCNAC